MISVDLYSWNRKRGTPVSISNTFFVENFCFCHKLMFNIIMFRSWSTSSRRYSGVRERAAVWSSRPRIIPPNTATDPLSTWLPEDTQDHQQAITFRCPTPNVFFVITCFNLTCVSFFQIAVDIKAVEEIFFFKWKQVKRRRMADQAARNLQYEYKANSNLVLQADLR